MQSFATGVLRTDLDLQQANFHMTEQRIVLGEPPEVDEGDDQADARKEVTAAERWGEAPLNRSDEGRFSIVLEDISPHVATLGSA